MALDYTYEPWVKALQLQRDDLTAALKAANKRAEAAEARAADLLEANRELSEALTTLRAELEAKLAGAARVIVTLTKERDEARRELLELRGAIIESGTS